MHIRISSFLCYENHCLCYKIFGIGSFSCITVFSCLVRAARQQKAQRHKFINEE